MEGRNIPKIKITNNSQFIKLVELMEENSDIARGFPNVGKTKEDVNRFWQELAITLNSLGPPTKEPLEWRKVWNDYKRNLKQKIAKNHEETRKTGGGQGIQYTLTPLEQQVDAILHLQKSGAPTGLSYGVDACRHNNATNLEVSAENTNSNPVPSTSSHIENILIEDHLLNIENEAPNMNKRNSHKTSHKDEIEKKRLALLDQQSNKQTETVEILKKIEKNTYNMQHYFKKSYELKEKKIKLLELQLERQQRNDLQKNRLIVQKLEIKRRILALEERKLGIGNSNNSSESESTNDED